MGGLAAAFPTALSKAQNSTLANQPRDDPHANSSFTQLAECR
jgi:hypothetical protein